MGKVAGVILAAGKGVRMKSELPKVLHEVAGLPMLEFVIQAMRQAGIEDLYVVVGNRKELLRERFADAGLTFVDQDQQLGTGHAVKVTEPVLGQFDGDVVVVNGDNPLLRAETICQAVRMRSDSGVSCVVVTARVNDPFGYGRIVRSHDDLVERIVEQRDASDRERDINEVNSGNYVFVAVDLFRALDRLSSENDQGEYLLTDVVKLLREDGRAVQGLVAADPAEVLGINSREQLAMASRLLQQRINERWMSEGVTLVSPETTFIDPRVVLGPDTVVEPCVVIRGRVKVGSNCRIGPFVELTGPLEVPEGKTVRARSEGRPEEV